MPMDSKTPLLITNKERTASGLRLSDVKMVQRRKTRDATNAAAISAYDTLLDIKMSKKCIKSIKATI